MTMKRRNFLGAVGAAGFAVSALPTMVDRFAVKALAGGGSPLHRLLGASDRILVLIQLQGGNQMYYDARPRISIAKNKTIALTDSLGWHPAMSGFNDVYQSGKMAVIQGVTYPNPDRSHFRGTDIWLTATDPEVFGTSGWIGRYLDTLAPDYPQVLPPSPLAVQIGTSLSLGLQGPKGAMGVSFRDPEEFYRIVNSGGSIEEIPSADYGDTPAGREVRFMRDVAKSADVYASVVKNAADSAQTSAIAYPNTDIGGKLRVVSQLISGGLQSKVFLVSWANNNFDTHANQVNAGDPTVGAHANLLRELSDAVSAFMKDMKALGLEDRVAGMTFSEFGRRVAENGSIGTDHGTAAPLFVFGSQVNGAVYGNDPDLENLDNRGDMLMQYDYRDIYASVLLQWFAEPNSLAAEVLYRDFSSTALPLFKTPTSVREEGGRDRILHIRSISPNPASTDVIVKVDIGPFSHAGLDVITLDGRRLASVPVDAFSGTARFSVSALPAGAYVLSLRTEGVAAHSILHVQR
jgi:uncharacterized protein (DUF1501 family)